LRSIAGGTIKPGHLVKIDASDNAVVHADADDPVLVQFVLEDELRGKGIDDNYTSGALVFVWVPYRGDIVNALCKGEAISKGDMLQSNGDGALKKLATGTAIAQATEAVTPGDGEARIQVRIL